MVIAEELVLSEYVPEIRERVVVSPCVGRFWPLPPEVFTTEGEWVEPGTALAEIDVDGERVPVRSVFRGWVMGMLALPGQPVATGEALFWIWSS
jgi:biotin carboxyl carrier protein